MTKEKDSIRLIGLSLPGKTTNKDGQSSIACGELWQKFETENYPAKIPDKVSDEIYAVYYDYEGDHTKPFSYFIGCRVTADAGVPSGMTELEVPAGKYHKVVASGKMPDCMTEAWKAIWRSDVERKYNVDYEVYDQRSKDWNQAEVDIYLSIV